jgi:hypothetical protein
MLLHIAVPTKMCLSENEYFLFAPRYFPFAASMLCPLRIFVPTTWAYVRVIFLLRRPCCALFVSLFPLLGRMYASFCFCGVHVVPSSYLCSHYLGVCTHHFAFAASMLCPLRIFVPTTWAYVRIIFLLRRPCCGPFVSLFPLLERMYASFSFCSVHVVPPSYLCSHYFGVCTHHFAFAAFMLCPLRIFVPTTWAYVRIILLLRRSCLCPPRMFVLTTWAYVRMYAQLLRKESFENASKFEDSPA